MRLLSIKTTKLVLTMEVFVAKNAVLRYGQSKPYIRLEKVGELVGEPSVMFIWYVHGFPETDSKYISTKVKQQLSETVGLVSPQCNNDNNSNKIISFCCFAVNWQSG